MSDDRLWCMVMVLTMAKTTMGRAISGGIYEDTVVHTSLGAIRGIEQTYEGAKVNAFLGVPYGRPPVGHRRFGIPEMIEKWTGELEAREPAKTCFLMIDTAFPNFPGADMWNPRNTITEDCLNMNIWVPANHDGSIMVWIYGGGFFSGSPSLDLYDGTVLAAKHNTIVININYRLGPFGFLYFGDDSAVPGNMGLLDQQLALKWINTHIGSFGGDASRVTLFGESAGSASATAHLAAPDSYKYFNKIIAKSGSIINSWASRTPDTMLELSMRLAKRLNCTTSRDVAAIHHCMKNIPPDVVQREADVVSNEIGLPMTFAFVPVRADRNFFKGDVFDRLRRRDFKKDVAAILGTVKDEGTYWLPYYMTDHGFKFNHTITAEDSYNRALISQSQYKQSMEAFMPYFGSSPLVKHALMNAYQHVSDKTTLQERLRDGVGRFLGDYFFTCSLIDFADILSDNVFGPVYMYYFTLRSSANLWPSWMGVMHGYEIEYAFGQPFRSPGLYTQERLIVEQKFSNLIMKLWMDFANTGNAAPYWPKYNRVERKALQLGEESVKGHHKIVVDVHGSFCRLIEEAKAVAGQASECRARRTEPAAIQHSNSGGISLTASSSLIITYSLVTLILRILL